MKTFFALLISGTVLAMFGCSGGSSSGSDAGTGGAIATGGAASGGATGTGGTSGASGSAGHAGTGGGAGQAGTTGGAGGHGGGGAGGHAGGGAGGHGGVTALGGAGGHGAGGASGGGGAGGAISCGKNVCTGNQYCCSESCGLCAPIGSACIAIACTDAGLTFDAGACVATPALDSNCTAIATPHSYRCILSSLPPPCVTQGIGDVTNTFCCP